MRIELREEVELINGQKTKSIEMREPTRADMKFAYKFDADEEKEDQMLIRLTGISQEGLDNLPICDSKKLQDALEEMGAVNYDPKR